MKIKADSLDDVIVLSGTLIYGKETSGGYIPDVILEKIKTINQVSRLSETIDELQKAAPPLYDVQADFNEQCIMLIKKDSYDKTKIKTARLLYFHLPK